MKKIFIDGSAGTTGLKIKERLAGREDISLITLPEERRKDSAARKGALNEADVVFLCLPDDAAREAVAMIENADTVVIDASTAHRTLPGWAYGLPELGPEFEEKIRAGKRIAVPGCHASGFLALVYPLVASGLLDRKTVLSCLSLTGYSGAGKPVIAEYEGADRDPLLSAPRLYALGQQHKHLKEMKAVSGLAGEPVFLPVIDDFFSGMSVAVPLHSALFANGNAFEEIRKLYRELYQGPVVTYRENAGEVGFLSALSLSGKDSMEISVSGNEERFTLNARYDNLGKGASGAAVECLNLVLGVPKTTGLIL